MALRSYKKIKKHLLEVSEDALRASIRLKLTGTLRPTCDENPRIVGLLWKPSENLRFFQNVVSPRPAALDRRPAGVMAAAAGRRVPGDPTPDWQHGAL